MDSPSGSAASLLVPHGIPNGSVALPFVISWFLQKVL